MAQRLRVSVPGATAAELVALAEAAERWNLDGVVLGDLDPAAANADDSYVLTTAGAVAARTTDLRVGLFLHLRTSAPLLRVVEDLGVVDLIAGGRTDVLALVPTEDRDGWDADVAKLAAAWHDWPLDDGRLMPVTPAPAQPWLPIVPVSVTGDGVAHGRPRPDGHASATVAIVDWEATEAAPTADDIVALRARAGDCGTIVLRLTTGVPSARAMAVMGTVVGPALRSAVHEVPILVADATTWLDERAELHVAPFER